MKLEKISNIKISEKNEILKKKQNNLILKK
jgi:hypothetical protein